jgi:hypothetical protein
LSNYKQLQRTVAEKARNILKDAEDQPLATPGFSGGRFARFLR